METRTYKVYKFDELTEKQKEKVLERYADINVDYDWWDFIYEDAANIGLEITAFDIDRGQSCEGKFLASGEESAHKIEKDHGEKSETYKTATDYLERRDACVNNAERDADGELVNEYALDEALDKLDAEFLHDLLEDYRMLLQEEYEYKTSREAIIETIKANDYDFTEDGKID